MRYVVHPSYVKSRQDGDVHWIGFAQLCRLYNLPPGSTNVADGEVPGYREEPGDVHLHPRVDGNYPMFEEKS
jgi:hypothetical protein